MKIVIGVILGGLIVAAIAIWFPILSDTKYEIVEKEIIHPCQQIIFDYTDMFNKVSGFDRYSASLQDIEEFEKNAKEQYGIKLREFEQTAIKYNCYDFSSEWLTDDFKSKIAFLTKYGFLP